MNLGAARAVVTGVAMCFALMLLRSFLTFSRSDILTLLAFLMSSQHHSVIETHSAKRRSPSHQICHCLSASVEGTSFKRLQIGHTDKHHCRSQPTFNVDRLAAMEIFDGTSDVTPIEVCGIGRLCFASTLCAFAPVAVWDLIN